MQHDSCKDLALTERESYNRSLHEQLLGVNPSNVNLAVYCVPLSACALQESLCAVCRNTVQAIADLVYSQNPFRDCEKFPEEGGGTEHNKEHHQEPNSWKENNAFEVPEMYLRRKILVICMT